MEYQQTKKVRQDFSRSFFQSVSWANTVNMNGPVLLVRKVTERNFSEVDDEDILMLRTIQKRDWCG
jgi:hypothetical protein